MMIILIACVVLATIASLIFLALVVIDANESTGRLEQLRQQERKYAKHHH